MWRVEAVVGGECEEGRGLGRGQAGERVWAARTGARDHPGMLEMLVPDDQFDLRGVVRRRVKGEGVEVVAEYGSLAAWSPEDGDELKYV